MKAFEKHLTEEGKRLSLWVVSKSFLLNLKKWRNKKKGTGGSRKKAQEEHRHLVTLERIGGIRVGGEGGKGKAAKIWEARDFKNLDDDVELGTRNMKVALRRLRKLIRDSANEEFDLDNTISSTAKKAGLLDVKFRPEKRCSKSLGAV